MQLIVKMHLSPSSVLILKFTGLLAEESASLTVIRREPRACTRVSFTEPPVSSAGRHIGSWEQINGDNRGQRGTEVICNCWQKALRRIDGDVRLRPNSQDESVPDL